MRDIERLLVAANLSGRLLMGVRHDPAWFPIQLAAFALYVVLADRALRRRIGPRHWPSEGFARFTFNTNLYFAACHIALGALLFAVAGTAVGIVGF
ncbi:hypothetical protein PRN20_15150 [Devosia sp. ZB163]|uniref:hypothetical protein n=1 Tax=Devosia sp. ZB163 TaxID=3025938 RepID=UPI00236003AF|nr:hypothetical protein [Devosia sp. ZB163]MDC9825067.1 hypothetical protein [Devosia sp. ZB163]